MGEIKEIVEETGGKRGRRYDSDGSSRKWYVAQVDQSQDNLVREKIKQ